jgi:hypothetical protein
VPEPMKLELYFAADRGFESAWRETISKAADAILAEQVARELAGGPCVEEIVDLAGAEEAEGLERVMTFSGQVPWPRFVVAEMDTIAATFSFYVTTEVQRRLDLRGKG